MTPTSHFHRHRRQAEQVQVHTSWAPQTPVHDKGKKVRCAAYESCRTMRRVNNLIKKPRIRAATTTIIGRRPAPIPGAHGAPPAPLQRLNLGDGGAPRLYSNPASCREPPAALPSPSLRRPREVALIWVHRLLRGIREEGQDGGRGGGGGGQGYG